MDVNNFALKNKIEFANSNTDKANDVSFCAEIYIDQIEVAGYQRKCNMNRVKKIATDFDVHRMRPIDVSYRDNKFYVVDGQHRYEAYKMMGMKLIPATLHFGLSEQDEASLFARQSDNVGAVTVRNKWNALESVDDPTIVRIVGIAARHGFSIKGGRVTPYQRKHGMHHNTFECVNTIYNAYSKYGEAMLDNVFGVIENAWKYSESMTHATIFNALVMIFDTYGNSVNPSALAKGLSSVSPVELLVNMNSTRDLISIRNTYKRCAVYILSLYNKIKRGKVSLNVNNIIFK